MQTLFVVLIASFALKNIFSGSATDPSLLQQVILVAFLIAPGFEGCIHK